VVALPAHAETRLRIATIAPDGTAWARELRAFSREVDEVTAGEVKIKWYMGGIAGDELQVGDRIAREQLDGFASGGVMCEKISPTFRGLRAPGMFENRDEFRWVAGQLRPTIEAEFAKAGFTYLGHAVLGSIEVFTRNPVRSLAELKREKMWMWDVDEITHDGLAAVGLKMVSLPIEAVTRSYTEEVIDGFLAVPAAMLAFQWSAQARYVTELNAINWLMACSFVTTRAMDRLAIPHQQAVRAATAKLSNRLDVVGQDLDHKLLNGAFGKQGLTPMPASAAFKTELRDAARAATEQGKSKLSSELVKRVAGLIGEYRRQHAQR
jgi:TRAP-type transport system periplasmic protein